MKFGLSVNVARFPDYGHFVASIFWSAKAFKVCIYIWEKIKYEKVYILISGADPPPPFGLFPLFGTFFNWIASLTCSKQFWMGLKYFELYQTIFYCLSCSTSVLGYLGHFQSISGYPWLYPAQTVIFPANPRTLFAGNAITRRKFNEIWTKLWNYLFRYCVQLKLHNQEIANIWLKFVFFMG